MAGLPPELAAFSHLLDAQPALVRNDFRYCLYMLLDQEGKLRLLEKVRSQYGVVCVFAPCREGQTIAGERFSVVEPRMSKATRAALIDELRVILTEKGYL